MILRDFTVEAGEKANSLEPVKNLLCWSDTNCLAGADGLHCLQKLFTEWMILILRISFEDKSRYRVFGRPTRTRTWNQSIMSTLLQTIERRGGEDYPFGT
jgi:hypothetical protein